MGIILNLETATTNCSVGIAREGRLLALKENNSINYSHSEQLHVFIKEVLDEASLSFTDISAVAVSKGPGSYTGLRIGVSAAKGLCYALDIPLISVATLQSMAHQIAVTPDAYIVPMLDARRMEVYSAVFDSNYQQIADTKAEIINEDSFNEWTQKSKVHFVGSGAEKCSTLLDSPNLTFHPKALPSAKEMSALSWEKYAAADFEDLAYFEPYYLKDFMLQQKS
ncbi:tRNA (adenosine(37)-N6)-threonylcarbamoyltransferase complex dimerization subunit type 1 TsaB [Arenibacter sp. GZD96]|uniref:tRNA (adenosine(37)-N6)-threonylcarbamoyltransferase complex dimerization subunit type 1 TsaB n=1 Tax=Aurantibrevibacter litoralis TaxID=3106030 RepID=UPI002AFEEE32|nr:tRNA (adenosine(37)-N6)-threonylcarbamoyltransferase complex dimerization subunit type 1 TsaB [Arenibacter sp. GZD-96]MEA1784611.1 tRNA (adenosine(37)-N6)-threonylcarbamoyltransferase complex dimerization subunit type 1 TsaB [Arenibacter sp. GZD-96]